MRKLIGHVDVDSGQLMLCDPCYIHDWNDKYEVNEADKDQPEKFTLSYTGACLASGTEDRAGELRHSGGHTGAGVCVESGYGDGTYPVYVTYNREGRAIKMEVLFEE